MRTLNYTVRGRYREPYNAGHASVTWNLVLGKKLLWVSKQHGHSVQVMLAMYATWIDDNGAEAEVAAIEAAMTGTPAALAAQLEGTQQAQGANTAAPTAPPQLAVA